MKNNIKIIDNVLNYDDFSLIESCLLKNSFPWFFNDCVVQNIEDSKNVLDVYSLNNHQFTHSFYGNFSYNSNYSNLLNPIIKVLNPISLIAIKANLLTVTENYIEHGFHIDISTLKDSQKSTTAIFYVNTNNGYTKFEDSTIVESVANRLVIFDSKILHTGSTCTNEKIRVVINFNYF